MSTIITDYAGLVAIGDDLAGDYILGNDIDASGETWTPLGTFTGTLDGKVYSIADLTITLNAAGAQSGALFEINQGIIKNLDFTDCTISVTSTNNMARAACIAYQNDGGTIQNCHITGTVAATTSGVAFTASAAGIAVYNQNGGTIIECSSTSTVSATSVSHCFGGGISAVNTAIISESFNSGDITVTSSYVGAAAIRIEAGGLVARNGYTGWPGGEDGMISDSYNRGNATASGGGTSVYAGGLVAHQETAGSTIDDSYSTGVPIADTTLGGLCGVDVGTITNSFWDTETSGTAVSDGGTGKTTAQMKTKSTFTDANWDFIVIWGINGITNDGYPFLWAILPEPLPDSPRRTVAIEDKITLESIRNIEMAAMGRFRVDKEGNAVYRSRYARNA